LAILEILWHGHGKSRLPYPVLITVENLTKIMWNIFVGKKRSWLYIILVRDMEIMPSIEYSCAPKVWESNVEAARRYSPNLPSGPSVAKGIYRYSYDLRKSFNNCIRFILAFFSLIALEFFRSGAL
jgi:hypothetical protein